MMKKWNLCLIMCAMLLFVAACSSDDTSSGLIGGACSPEGIMDCDGTIVVKCESGTWKNKGDCAQYEMACVVVNDVAQCAGSGTDTDTGTTDTDTGTTDTGTDTDTDTGTTDTDTTTGCGNGFTEAGEVCDGGVKNCTELGFASGFAECKPDCSGWDTSTCQSGSDTDTMPDTDTPTTGKTCGEINSCMNTCPDGDQACYQACYDSGSADGKAKFDALMNCLETNCLNECGSSGNPTDCNACADANCADEMDACFTNPNAPVYGTVNANSTQFKYIYNGDADLNQQIQSNMSGVVLAAVFTGTYGTTNKPIPGMGAQQTLALAVHYAASGSNPAVVAVMQQSQTQTSIVNPIVQLVFPTDNISPGQYDMDPTKQDSVVLVLLNAIGTQDACLLAYCFSGTTNVTAAVNTTAPSGGSITMGVTNAKVYYPKETPIGDISGQIQGITTCAKE